MDYDLARHNMVECQLKTEGITGASHVKAFYDVQREAFYPDHVKPFCFLDEDVQLTQNRWAMDPVSEAKLIKAADVKPTDIVLLIGASSPAMAAYLSHLCSSVIVIDDDPALLDAAKDVYERLSLVNVEFVHVQDMTQGYDQNAPYDAIIIAGSVSKAPNTLESQLIDGGRSSYVLKQDPHAPGQLMRALKYSNVSCEAAMLDNVNTPYLPSFEPQEEFTF